MICYQVRKKDFTCAFGTSGFKVIQDVPPKNVHMLNDYKVSVYEYIVYFQNLKESAEIIDFFVSACF